MPLKKAKTLLVYLLYFMLVAAATKLLLFVLNISEILVPSKNEFDYEHDRKHFFNRKVEKETNFNQKINHIRNDQEVNIQRFQKKKTDFMIRMNKRMEKRRTNLEKTCKKLGI